MATIFAVSSGQPPAAIAILRISGPEALKAGMALAGTLPEDRRATLRALRDPRDGTLLDRALVIVFRAPDTATGEDLVELHLHGGRAVVAAVERVLSSLAGLRMAEPGEFTRRAMANGRIDLTEAEGLGDLLSAETESPRRAALQAADGGVRRRIEDWARRVLALSAQLEAQLDFADEDDVTATDLAALAAGAAALAAEVTEVTAQPSVERVRDGVRVVLAGPANSGKSTLINALTGRDTAIVSPIAGTTRDRIEAPVSRNGIAYVIIDTAGLAYETKDIVEQIGIERAQSAIAAADVLLWLGDSPPAREAIWLHARADETQRSAMPVGPVLAVSGRAGGGILELWSLIEAAAKRLLPSMSQVALNARQRALACEAADALAAASQANDPLIVAEELGTARRAFDKVTGRSDTEAMLDALFGKFCIGK